MSTITITQEAVLHVAYPGEPDELYTLQSPLGQKWDLVANGTTGSLTITDGSTGIAQALLLFDPNNTPWQLTVDDTGVLTVKGFDQDIVLSPAINAPITIGGTPAMGYELYATDSSSGLGALLYKNGLFVNTQPSPVILNEFGLPSDPVYIVVGNAYTFKLFPPGGGQLIKEWPYVVGGIAVNTDLATEWGAAVSAGYVTSTSFSIQGDARINFPIARRVKINDLTIIYGVVIDSTYDGEQTTVVVSTDSGPLSPVLLSVHASLLTPRSSPVPSRRYSGSGTTFVGNLDIGSSQGLNLLAAGLMALYPNPGILAAPSGWVQCNGQAISRTTYAALFAAVGTFYGAGNGTTTFNVPNLAAVGSLVYYIYTQG